MCIIKIYCLVLFTMKQPSFFFRDIPRVLGRLRGASLICFPKGMNWVCLKIGGYLKFACFLMFSYVPSCCAFIDLLLFLLCKIWWLSIRVWIDPTGVWMTSGILPNQLRSPPSPQPTVRGRAERCDTLQLWKCTSQKNTKKTSKKMVLRGVLGWFLKFARC